MVSFPWKLAILSLCPPVAQVQASDVPPPPPPAPPPPAPSPPGPTPPSIIIDAALQYLGAKCDSLTAVGCNPSQLPVWQGQQLVPQVLLKVNAEDIFVNQHQETDGTTKASVSRSVFDETEADAGSFGISGSVPYDDVVFSGGVQHQHLVETMYSHNAIHFYSEVQRKMTVYTASLTKPQEAVDGLQQAIDDLPYGVESKEDQLAWLTFFGKYGTHYINSVSFGGLMRLTTFIDESKTEDADINENDFGFYLAATFDKMVGLNVSWDDDHTEAKFDKFSNAQLEQDLRSVGGDQSIVDDFEKWLRTVEADPAPIFTTLGSFADLLTSKNSTAALKVYFDACPSTDQNGVCNGYGHCDPLAGTCTCSHSSSLDHNGNCYLCPKDSSGNDCSGRGTCVKGQCQCHKDEETHMGWTGQDCSQPCGKHSYHAASDSDFPTKKNSDATNKQWRIATTWNSDNFLAPTGKDATCWCKHVLSNGGLYDSGDLDNLRGSYLDTSKHWENTYSNCDESRFCHAWPTSKCLLVATVECSFILEECDNNVIVVPTGPKAINASLDARAEPVQRFAFV